MVKTTEISSEPDDDRQHAEVAGADPVDEGADGAGDSLVVAHAACRRGRAAAAPVWWRVLAHRQFPVVSSLRAARRDTELSLAPGDRGDEFLVRGLGA